MIKRRARLRRLPDAHARREIRRQFGKTRLARLLLLLLGTRKVSVLRTVNNANNYETR